MKKIFNNGLRVFNTAMFMAAVVATSLFASCSKDSVNQNDPTSATQEKTQEQTKENTPAKLRVFTKYGFSKGLEDYLDIKVTAKGANGEELQNQKKETFKQFEEGSTAHFFAYDNKTMPSETSVKAEITLKDKTAKLPEGGLDVYISYRCVYSFIDANGQPIKCGGDKLTTQTPTLHVKTPEQLEEAVKSLMTCINIDKTHTFKFDAKCNITTGVVQE